MLGRLGLGRKLRKHSALTMAAKIHTHTTHDEREILFDLVCKQPAGSKVLEIGSYLGSSTVALAAAVKEIGGHLYCVDTWMNQTMPEGELDTYKSFHENTVKYKKYITTLRKNSADILISDLPAQFGMVFLDGDHSYEMVKSDFYTIRKFITPQTTIVFHDIRYFEGVSRFVGECLVSNEWRIYGVVNNLGWLKQTPR